MRVCGRWKRKTGTQANPGKGPEVGHTDSVPERAESVFDKCGAVARTTDPEPRRKPKRQKRKADPQKGCGEDRMSIPPECFRIQGAAEAVCPILGFNRQPQDKTLSQGTPRRILVVEWPSD